jgi:chromate transporter
MARASTLREIAAVFLRLGLVAFGGPAAHIAMMEEEIVRKRGWMTREAFLDRLGAANLIPGPNSTEVAIHVGHDRGGFAGLVVAGACFILPAALMTGALGWAYVRFGSRPEVGGVLWGVKPVVVAIVAHALHGLAKSAVKSPLLGVLGAACVLASLAGVSELALLVIAGALAILARRARDGASLFAPAALATSTAALAAAPPTTLGVFGVFLKIGSVLYGSGYVLLAFLRADLVERRHWLTEGQLLDAVAVGQVTPGPVFATATFLGYVLRGPWGAVAATAGIFLPAFVFVAISGPLIPRLRRSAAAGAFLDGVNVASLGLMAAVTIELARDTLVDPWAIAIAVVSLALVVRKVNTTWLVAGGALAGLARAWLAR